MSRIAALNSCISREGLIRLFSSSEAGGPRAVQVSGGVGVSEDGLKPAELLGSLILSC